MTGFFVLGRLSYTLDVPIFNVSFVYLIILLGSSVFPGWFAFANKLYSET